MPGDEKRVPATAPGVGQPAGGAKTKLNSYSNYIIPRSAKSSSGWVHGPANLKLLKVSERALMDTAIQRGMKVRQPSDLQSVRAALIEGQTSVHIYPIDETDADGIKIRRNRAGTWINLITLLAPEKMLVEAGYKESFVINQVGEEGPVGPAITLDMAKPVERKLIGKRKRSQEGTPGTETAAGSDENE